MNKQRSRRTLKMCMFILLTLLLGAPQGWAQHPLLKTVEAPQENTVSPRAGGLLDTHWTQNYPYNQLCPRDPVNGYSYSYAGCPAIAMGQIINYLRTTQGTRFTDSDDYAHNYGGRNYLIDDDWESLQFPSFPQLNFLLDSVDATFQRDEVLPNELAAAVVFACGTALRQVYTSESSGTFTVDQAYAAYQRFGFTECQLYREPSSEMYATLISNLQAGYPAHLAVENPAGTVGHNVVVDGYREEDGKFHVNFGYGGSLDDWYYIPDPNFYYGMTKLEGIIVNIIPDAGPASTANWYGYALPPSPAANKYITFTMQDLGSVSIASDTHPQAVAATFADGYVWSVNNNNNSFSICRSRFDAATNLIEEPETMVSGISYVADMEYNPADGLVYFIMGEHLRSFDPGNPNNIQDHGAIEHDGFNLAIDMEGHAYMISSWGEFGVLNLSNAQLTVINPIDLPLKMAFDMMTGELFGIHYGNLYQLDPTTGAYTLLGALHDGSDSYDPSFMFMVYGTEDCISFSEAHADGIAVYPNPTDGMIKIEAENMKSIIIFNLLGEKVFECSAYGDAFEYDFSHQSAGIYFIQVETTKGIETTRVIIK